MYIKLSTLCYGILFILGVVALILIIVAFYKIVNIVTKFNGFMDRNKENIDNTLNYLPKTTENFHELSDSLKNVGDVITETTATAIEKGEHVGDFVNTVKDIINIILNVIEKKKDK